MANKPIINVTDADIRAYVYMKDSNDVSDEMKGALEPLVVAAIITSGLAKRDGFPQDVDTWVKNGLINDFMIADSDDDREVVLNKLLESRNRT